MEEIHTATPREVIDLVRANLKKDYADMSLESGRVISQLQQAQAALSEPTPENIMMREDVRNIATESAKLLYQNLRKDVADAEEDAPRFGRSSLITRVRMQAIQRYLEISGLEGNRAAVALTENVDEIAAAKELKALATQAYRNDALVIYSDIVQVKEMRRIPGNEAVAGLIEHMEKANMSLKDLNATEENELGFARARLEKRIHDHVPEGATRSDLLERLGKIPDEPDKQEHAPNSQLGPLHKDVLRAMVGMQGVRGGQAVDSVHLQAGGRGKDIVRT
jgi:hypothetical protein